MPFSRRNGASSHHLKTNSYEWSTGTIRRQQFQTSKTAASSCLQLASRCTVPLFLSDTSSRRLNFTQIPRDKTSNSWTALRMVNILCCIAASSFQFHENRTNRFIENYSPRTKERVIFGKRGYICRDKYAILIKNTIRSVPEKAVLMKWHTNSTQKSTAFRAKPTTFQKKSPCFYGISSRISG